MAVFFNCQRSQSELRQEALDAVDEIAAVTDIDTLYELLGRRFRSYGFEHFIISGIPLPHESLDRAIMLRHWPRDWFDLYFERDFVRIDPAVTMALSTAMPFEWSDAPIELCNREAAEVMNIARDFGLLRGFFLPIHGINGSTACVSLGGKAPELTDTTMPALHLIAMYAFEHARRLYVRPRNLDTNPLTPREQEVLVWSAAGKCYGEIAQILSITKRTVTAHAVSATTKLGASNKTHAVVKAMRRRLISV